MLWTTGSSPLIRCGVFSHTDQPYSWHDPSKAWEEECLRSRLMLLLVFSFKSIVVHLSAEQKASQGLYIQQTLLLRSINTCWFSPTLPPVLMCVTVGSERAEDPAFPLVMSASTRSWGQRARSPMVWHHERAQRSQGYVRGGGDTTMTKWHGMDRIPSHNGNHPSETIQGDASRLMQLMFVMLEFNWENLIGSICIVCMVLYN